MLTKGPRMNQLFKRTAVAVFACVTISCAYANTPEVSAAHARSQPGAVERAEGAIIHGVKAAARGLERGVRAAASGVARGVKATVHGVDRGAKATAKVTNSAAKKTGGTPASESSAAK
jgi:hypothetical protein